ncbi:MAG: hypothetical protein ACK5W0_03110 [Labrys sp. (in: a-proteobacteria)]
MADHDSTTSIAPPSRRGVVFYGSAFVAAAALAPPVSDIALDVIARHRAALEAFEVFCASHADPDLEPEHAALADAEWAAWESVYRTEPETVRGAALMARHVAEHIERTGYEERHATALFSLANALDRLA